MSKKIEPDRKRDVEAPAPARAKKKARRRPIHVMAMLTTTGFLRRAVRLSGRLAHAFRVRDLFVWLRAGFEDPADTGLLCAVLMPVATYLEARHPGQWDVAPEFSAPTFGFAMHGRLSVTPARLLSPLLVFGLSPSTIRGFIALRTGRSA